MFILLVEDEPMIRSACAEFIRELGHQVVEADSAEQAMTVLRTSSVDVLITDIGLPGMSGEVFAAEALSLRPALRIIFATGQHHIAAAFAKGDGPLLLRKPYSLQSVAAALAALAAV